MATLWASLFLLLLAAVLLLHVFSLPANWILAALVALWKLGHPETMTWGFVLLLLAIAALGEILEFTVQYFGAKRFGSSGKGNLGGMVGALAGAILGAPFFFGLGALFGALGGAYAGCYIMEVGRQRSPAEARRAAWGAFWGKFFGLGVAMLTLSAGRVWP